MNNFVIGSQTVTVPHPFPHRNNGKLEFLDRSSLRQKVRKSRRFFLFVSDRPGTRPYTLVFEDDEPPSGAPHVQCVRVASIDDVHRYRFFLGNSCELYLSSAFAEAHPEIPAALQALEPGLSRGKPPVDMDEAALLLRKLPANLREMLLSPLAVMEGDRYPDAIDCRYIHKRHSGNALISQPWCNGKFLYFNMFAGIDEFRFDHESDHVQGMLILEAMRQSGIATTHITGNLPLDGGITLLSYANNFYNYLEKTAPVIIRAYSDFSFDDGKDVPHAYAVCQLFQWGKLCAEALLNACIFKTREEYAGHRFRSRRIAERVKRQFESRVSACNRL